jgi:hypothetical protein
VQIDWVRRSGQYQRDLRLDGCAGVNVLITGLTINGFLIGYATPSSHPDAGILHVPATRNTGAGSQQQCSVR